LCVKERDEKISLQISKLFLKRFLHKFETKEVNGKTSLPKLTNFNGGTTATFSH
jgi:hypothetical protein